MRGHGTTGPLPWQISALRIVVVEVVGPTRRDSSTGTSRWVGLHVCGTMRYEKGLELKGGGIDENDHSCTSLSKYELAVIFAAYSLLLSLNVRVALAQRSTEVCRTNAWAKTDAPALEI